MFKRIYTSDAFEALKGANYGKACYSWDGVNTLLEFYDQIDENTEFDAYAIMSEWTEYGNESDACDFNDLVTDYGYLVDKEDDESMDDYIGRLVYELERHTTILYVNNGDYLVAVF